MSNELSSPWVFWFSSVSKRYNKHEAKHQYEKELVSFYEVKTVQQFFNTYCYLQKLSDMEKNDCISFFRKGSKPMWENSPSGGC